MKFLSKIREYPPAIFIKMLPGKLREIWAFAKGNARARNTMDPSKSITDILMLTHSIEKSFSLPARRSVFGLNKAIELGNEIERHLGIYGYDAALVVPIDLLSAYISDQKLYQADKRLEELENKVQKIREQYLKTPVSDLKAGFQSMTKEMAQASGRGDFASLVRNRYSVRDFSGEKVEDSVIYEALELATKAPSACNRQAYRVHIYRGEEKDKLMEMQQGSANFHENTSAALIITADMGRYYTKESNLGYVDASLFGMTLIYALNYLGIATIPLTLGIEYERLQRIKKTFDIPAGEIPVLMIALGGYKDEFKVAVSHRNSPEYFTTNHQD